MKKRGRDKPQDEGDDNEAAATKKMKKRRRRKKQDECVVIKRLGGRGGKGGQAWVHGGDGLGCMRIASGRLVGEGARLAWGFGFMDLW